MTITEYFIIFILAMLALLTADTLGYVLGKKFNLS